MNGMELNGIELTLIQRRWKKQKVAEPTCSSLTPLDRASFRMLDSPAGGNLRSQSTAFGTLRNTDIHVEKIAGSILYSWLKLHSTNRSSGTPYWARVGSWVRSRTYLADCRALPGQGTHVRRRGGRGGEGGYRFGPPAVLFYPKMASIIPLDHHGVAAWQRTTSIIEVVDHTHEPMKDCVSRGCRCEEAIPENEATDSRPSIAKILVNGTLRAEQF